MRISDKYPGLRQVKGQIFTCGMFGTCSNSVLSPRTPPPHENPPHVFAPHGTILPLKQDKVFLANPQKILIERQEKAAESETRHAAERRFERIPSSTQWDFALEQEGRIKNRYLALIKRDMSPLEARTLKGRICEDSAALCLEVLVKEAFKGSVTEADVKNLRLLASQSEQNREWMVEAGVFSKASRLLISTLSERLDCCQEETFGLLLALFHSADEETTTMLLQPDILSVIHKFLRSGSLESKMNAMSFLLKIISRDDDSNVLVGYASGILESLLKILHDSQNTKLTKHAMKILLALCLCKQNRCRAVKAGAVETLIEVLPDLKSVSAERALATLELLCTTSEGRTAFLHHALGIPLIVTLILRVSDRGTEYAAGVLCSICTPENTEAQEMALQVCAPTQLLLLLQSDCTDRARRKALKLLKTLHRFCEDSSSCISAAQHLNASFK